MDLKNPRLIYLKAGLFVVAGCMAGAGVWLERPTVKVAALLAVTVWCFARAYYFAFYVIERYIDPAFKFAGLGSVAAYWWRGRARRRRREAPPAAGG